MDANGGEIGYTYDQNSNIIAITDALGNVTRYEYDAMRRLVKTVYPDGSVESGSFDKNGNVTSAVGADGMEVTAEYDGRGQLLSMTDGEEEIGSFSYDLNGNILSQTLASGLKANYTYDSRNRLTELHSENVSVSFAYDAAGNVTLMRVGDIETRYGYDSMGRLVSESDSDGNETRYTYDLAGQMVEKEENGKLSRASYDKNGNLLAIREVGSEKPLYRYEYNELDQLTAIFFEDGATTRYTYNAWGEQITGRYEKAPLQPSGMGKGVYHSPRLQKVIEDIFKGGGKPPYDPEGEKAQQLNYAAILERAHWQRGSGSGSSVSTAAPEVVSPTGGKKACSRTSVLDEYFSAKKSFNLGITNSFGEKFLDLGKSLIKILPYRHISVSQTWDGEQILLTEEMVDSFFERTRNSMNDKLRAEAEDDPTFDAGELTVDVILVLLAAKRMAQAASAAVDTLSAWMSRFWRTAAGFGSLALADGPAQSVAVSTTEAATGTVAVGLAGTLLAIGETLIEATGIPDHAQQLKEDIEEAENSDTSPGKIESPETYLDRALENQGIDSPPSSLKESWIEGDYKYEVRIHSGESQFTDSESIYRVSRQSLLRDANGQGTGVEYLGSDGNWYHESVLRQFNRNGTPNPLFDENAARITHIALSGGD